MSAPDWSGFVPSQSPTDDLIRYLGDFRFAARGYLNNRVRRTLEIRIRAIEYVLRDRGLSPEAIAAIK